MSAAVKYAVDLMMVLTAFYLLMRGIAGQGAEPFILIAVSVVMFLELVTDVLFHTH